MIPRMRRIRNLFTILLLTVPLLVLAQQTNEQLGSSYYAYPQVLALTPAPKGYKPIFLSHYGRHGSRWLTEDSRYEAVLKEFETHELTEAGKDVYRRLQIVWEDARGRSGELTSKGEKQHMGIAQRMVHNFPGLFGGDVTITMQSSTVRRCMMSMMAACEGIKELRPKAVINRSAYERDMPVINQESDELKEFKKSAYYRDIEDSIYTAYTNTSRLMGGLFVHPEQIENPMKLWDGLYWIASDMQNIERFADGRLSFYDLFTKEELSDYWKAVNYRMYVTNGPASINGGVAGRSSENLLKAIVKEVSDTLEYNIQRGKQTSPGIHLRYGHDSALLRLLTIMQVEECKQATGDDTDAENVCRHWHDYELTPMAANLQLVFYQGREGDIIMRLLLNERDAHLPLKAVNGCFYKWEDVKKLWDRE